ncbi:MAG: hypothetical protein GXY53_11180 [Desulfobulbus sp.]|nr:hypothetical protein [Desulfobulbus sp.]
MGILIQQTSAPLTMLTVLSVPLSGQFRLCPDPLRSGLRSDRLQSFPLFARIGHPVIRIVSS